jgi:hypothetical protein
MQSLDSAHRLASLGFGDRQAAASDGRVAGVVRERQCGGGGEMAAQVINGTVHVHPDDQLSLLVHSALIGEVDRLCRFLRRLLARRSSCKHPPFATRAEPANSPWRSLLRSWPSGTADATSRAECRKSFNAH